MNTITLQEIAGEWNKMYDQRNNPYAAPQALIDKTITDKKRFLLFEKHHEIWMTINLIGIFLNLATFALATRWWIAGMSIVGLTCCIIGVLLRFSMIVAESRASAIQPQEIVVKSHQTKIHP